jgi:hypothetical protein
MTRPTGFVPARLGREGVDPVGQPPPIGRPRFHRLLGGPESLGRSCPPAAPPPATAPAPRPAHTSDTGSHPHPRLPIHRRVILRGHRPHRRQRHRHPARLGPGDVYSCTHAGRRRTPAHALRGKPALRRRDAPATRAIRRLPQSGCSTANPSTRARIRGSVHGRPGRRGCSPHRRAPVTAHAPGPARPPARRATPARAPARPATQPAPPPSPARRTPPPARPASPPAPSR